MLRVVVGRCEPQLGIQFLFLGSQWHLLDTEQLVMDLVLRRTGCNFTRARVWELQGSQIEETPMALSPLMLLRACLDLKPALLRHQVGQCEGSGTYERSVARRPITDLWPPNCNLAQPWLGEAQASMDRKGKWTPPSLKLIGAYLFLACALFEIIDGTQMHYCSRKHGRQQPPVPEGGKSLEFDLVRLVSARKIRGRRYQRVKRRRIVGGRKLGWLSSVLKCLSGFRPRSMDDCLPLVTMTVSWASF